MTKIWISFQEVYYYFILPGTKNESRGIKESVQVKIARNYQDPEYS